MLSVVRERGAEVVRMGNGRKISHPKGPSLTSHGTASVGKEVSMSLGSCRIGAGGLGSLLAVYEKYSVFAILSNTS